MTGMEFLFNWTAASQYKDAAQRDAAIAYELADIKKGQIDRARRQSEGDTLAAAASSGLLASGSVLDILVDNAIEFELEKQQADWEARVNAETALYEGELNVYNARAAAVSDLLTGTVGAYTQIMSA